MKKLLNPIEFFNDKKLLLTNLIIFVIGTVISVFLFATFESPIDLHFSNKIVPEQTIIGNTISIISLFLSIFLSGKIINKKTRLIDCLNLALYLRIPYYFLTLLNLTHYISTETSSLNDTEDYIFSKNQLFEMFFAYTMILFFISFLVVQGIVMYRSFKTICNAKKTTDYLILVSILLAFIIISSLIIRNI